MIRNYFKIAVRNLKRNRTISAINILGLTFGLAIASLIGLYVQNELTYDSYHKDSKNIYRLYREISVGGLGFEGEQVSSPVGPYLVEHYPNVINQARISRSQDQNFSIEDKVFEEKFKYADSDFFKIFTYDFIYGDARTALIEPFSLVVSKKVASRFLGDINPVGSVVKDESGHLYKITGVFENVPENSHLKFDILCSFSTQYDLNQGENTIDGWGLDYNGYSTYVKLTDGYSGEYLAPEFPGIVKTYLSDNPDLEYSFSLQPIRDIYLYYKGGGDISRVILFGVIGIFVLLIACINYMNLNTADSIKRLKEIGMRKVLGAARKQLIRQLLFESIILSLISLILALTLAEILLPFFNTILQKNLSFNYLSNWPLSLSFIILAFITGILAGSYPAFYLSSIIPVNALKGKFVFGSKQALLRNALVVLQFAITIFLICCTGIIYMQIRHANKADMGFQKDDVLILRFNLKSQNVNANKRVERDDNTSIEIRNELLKFPEITAVSVASGFPFDGSMMVGHYIFEELEKEKVLVSYNVDENYMDLLGIKLIAGRGFSSENSLEDNNVIINETLARQMNWDDPEGKTFVYKDDNKQKFTVIGIVKDFNIKSFHEKIYPLYLKYDDSPKTSRSIGIKYNSYDVQRLISKIEKVCNEIDISSKVDIKFLSQSVEKSYMEDYRTGKMFTNFAILAIIIALMGLYGLALFISRQKTKEIGLRKIFGCSISEIILILSKNFIRLILISAMIGIPMAWYYMDKWLQSFIYQVENRWIIFALATLLAMVIAFVTIFYQSFKAATSNPVDAIKYE